MRSGNSFQIRFMTSFPMGIIRTFACVLLVLMPLCGFGQSLPVGTPVLEDAFRRGQLAGRNDSLLSLCIRPLFPETDLSKGKSVQFKLLPVTILTQYTSHHPYSINDGAMIPAKGFQSIASAGVFAKIGPLSIQLRPEYVYAQNSAFPTFPEEHSVNVWSEWYEFNANIDLPEKFGDLPYSKFNWGQSSVRLDAGPVSLGVSNENLWWGPGYRNSLLMTNTAPGFKHFTLNTSKPIKTPIGSFEFQLVVGRLDSSGFYQAVPDTNNPGYRSYYSHPKPNDWTYFNGLVVTWQPRWVKGLFLGAARSFQVYHKDQGTRFSDYLPVISPLTKNDAGNDVVEESKSNQLASLFMRWLWLKERAEVYIEFGRDDHAWNLRDFFLEPEHSSAWVAGFRKMIPFNHKPDQFIQVGLELTHMENSRVGMLYRSSGPWYLHSNVKVGYTQQGQLLGAGIGPGSNLQTLDISWVNQREVRSLEVSRLVLIGLRLERYVHNNDFHYLAIHDIRAHWVDFIATLNGQYAYKNFLFFTQLSFMDCINYEHLYVPREIIDSWWNPGVNVFNLQAQVGVSYRFN